MQAEYNISIITVNFNGYRDTAALIESIPRDARIELIVVDNGSRQNEAELLQSRYPHITALRSDENLGFAGGNNLGIRASHGQYLFFVNNDTVLEVESGEWKEERGERRANSSVFQPLIDRLESDPQIGAVCPKIRFAWADHPIQFAGYTPLSRITLRNAAIGFGEKDLGQHDAPHPTPYAHGAAMMVKREAIERARLMPECFFLYYEELDWSLMLRRAGYSIWYEPLFTIYHKESQSTGQGSALRSYYITRNRLLFARRNQPLSVRYLTYLYLLCLVTPRDVVNHLVHHQLDLASATFAGVRDFLLNRQNKRLAPFKTKPTSR